MRTTLTLDDETAALVRKALKEKKTSLKQIINDAIKWGLLLDEPSPKRKKFSTRPHDAGAVLVGDVVGIGDILSLMDEETRVPPRR